MVRKWRFMVVCTGKSTVGAQREAGAGESCFTVEVLGGLWVSFQVFSLFDKLCGAGRGLAHLHSLKPPICHGDIKPQNVLISDNMEALLCDFGISRIITESTTDMTTLGRATGTAGFASKEVIEGSGPTEKGDVYAFGGLILAVRFFLTQHILLKVLTLNVPDSDRETPVLEEAQ